MIPTQEEWSWQRSVSKLVEAAIGKLDETPKDWTSAQELGSEAKAECADGVIKNGWNSSGARFIARMTTTPGTTPIRF